MSDKKKQLLFRTFILPFADGSFGKVDDGIAVGGSRPSTRQGELKLTMSSITGLVGTGKEGFDPSKIKT